MSAFIEWLEGLPVWAPYLLILILFFFVHRLEKANEAIVENLNQLEDRLDELTSNDDDFHYLSDD